MKQKDTRCQTNCHRQPQKTRAVPALVESREGKRSLAPLSCTISLRRTERDSIAVDRVISPIEQSTPRWPPESAGMITRPHTISQRLLLPLRGQLR